MCLDTLWPAERIAALQAKPFVRAFKVVLKRDNKLVGPIKTQTSYKTRLQTNATNTKCRYGFGSNQRSYVCSFHAYLTRKGAEKNSKWNDSKRVIPVLMWDITGAGKQRGCAVVVARKMILLTDH